MTEQEKQTIAEQKTTYLNDAKARHFDLAIMLAGVSFSGVETYGVEAEEMAAVLRVLIQKNLTLIQSLKIDLQL